MNQHLQSILNFIEQSDILSSEQKNAIIKSLKDADKELEISAFKLDRTEKVKRTTAILLEETIEELEQKRKAVEAQNRELEIESSLERVRTAAMGMSKPDDLLTICEVMFKELKALGFSELRNTLIHTFVDEENYFIDYDYSDFTGGGISQIPYKGMPFVEKYIVEIRKSNDAFTEIAVTGEELEVFKEFRKKTGQINDPRLEEAFAIYYYNYSIGAGDVGISTFSSISEDKIEVLKRFRNVFDFAYRRYMDVAQAEAQAREATIEAALERVRGKAMAMHSSEDLAATISAFYHELELFSITPRRCGVGLLDKETHMAELSTMNTTQEGQAIELIGKLKMTGHPVLEGVFDYWLRQKEYHPVLQGNEIKEYYQVIRPQVAFPEYPNDAVQYGYFFFFTEGGVYAWTEKPLLEDELKIYRRFTTVLSLAYKRYKDLRDAETREKEAIKQASLDRVRADIASMRSTADLDRITPIIWRELTTLGVPFFRCGVFIINEEEQLVHVYLSTPEGKSLAVLHLSFDGAKITSNTVIQWRQQKTYIEHWNREQFMAWVQSLKGQGQVQSEQTYQAGQEPPESLTLQFIPFAQGMLYIGSTDPLNEDQLQLVKELSNAFSVAFARYEDFKKLEEAKSKIETTLDDLKAAQAQLIQSEKMASLGELTAGIAHEIQNPLNFVNNFTEVNKELLDEIQVERRKEKGERDEHVEDELLKTIMDNLEKINFHGKRADGIVKSMLQHSRSSEQSGKLKKEPTDINMLADEYLRLAYHGLRAKDQTFNATLKTDFDTSIGLIQVIPQDIARALLNLITNAFYAVHEKQRQGVSSSRGIGTPPVLDNYHPTVSITTKKASDYTVEIRVKDNGPGIPQNVLDKIFQPFFTTKPAGQGTGLGLSLAYDIIKAHQGELKVESVENEYTTFTIVLPIN